MINAERSFERAKVKLRLHLAIILKHSRHSSRYDQLYCVFVEYNGPPRRFHPCSIYVFFSPWFSHLLTKLEESRRLVPKKYLVARGTQFSIGDVFFILYKVFMLLFILHVLRLIHVFNCYQNYPISFLQDRIYIACKNGECFNKPSLTIRNIRSPCRCFIQAFYLLLIFGVRSSDESLF